MANSFPFVQAGSNTGLTADPTKASVTFGSYVHSGNVIVAAIGYNEDAEASLPPSSVTDTCGNLYELYAYSGGAYVNGVRNRNTADVSFIYLAQGTTLIPYGHGVNGGPCTIAFNGLPTMSSSRPGQPITLCVEFETPEQFYAFATNCQDENADGSPSVTVTFRSLVNQGNIGGSGAADTGYVGLTITETGGGEPSEHSPAALVLLSPTSDVLVVAVDFDHDGNLITNYTSSGSVAAWNKTGTDPDSTVAALAYQDFPYILPLALTCGNPGPGVVGSAYSQQMGPATGGTPPYTYSLSPVPPGLTFNTSTGVLSGTPTTNGIFSFTFSVTDSASTTVSITCTIPVLTQWIVQSVRITDTNRLKSYKVTAISGATVGDWRTALKYAINGGQ